MFCSNCGASFDGKFCPSCGTPTAGTAPPPAAGGPPQGAAGAAGMQDNVASALCYLLGLITGILFLALAPYNQNKLIRFHAFQSIFLHVGMIVLWIGLVMVNIIMPSMVSIMLGMLSMLVWLAAFVLWILLMLKAYQGQKWVLPIIGPLAEKQA
jgi:uncharacterized membrane protein